MNASPVTSLPPDADDLLARFADQALSGDQSLPEQMLNNPELESAAETILRLQAAFLDADVSPDEAERIHKNLLVVWRESYSTKKRFRMRIEQMIRAVFPKSGWRSHQIRQRWSLAVVMASVFLILILTFPLILHGTDATPAAAGWLPVAIGALIATVVLAVIAFFRAGRRP